MKNLKLKLRKLFTLASKEKHHFGIKVLWTLSQHNEKNKKF